MGVDFNKMVREETTSAIWRIMWLFQAWWHMLLISDFGKQKKVDLCEFEATLVYMVKPDLKK